MTDVALIHAGIADSRMWAPQLRSFAAEHRVIAPDLPGFGQSPFDSDVIDYRASVRAALDAAGMDRAAAVGTSFGGRIALELALESPERVSALVLVGPGLDSHRWSEEMNAFDNEEEGALARGDLDAAVDSQLRAWVAGPRRSLDAVDPGVRDLVAEMQRNAYELQQGHDDVRSTPLDPRASQRLSEISMPTLVVTGDEDFADIHEIADKLVAEIPGAKRATISDAAHLPNLERPEQFDRIVLGFLAEHGI
jgi:pimeloyl-ACP methyl ester carboxylesterase